MRKQFYVIVSKEGELGAISTGCSPGKRFVFERKGEADYYSLGWDGDVVKKATLIWKKNSG